MNKVQMRRVIFGLALFGTGVATGLLAQTLSDIVDKGKPLYDYSK